MSAGVLQAAGEAARVIEGVSWVLIVGATAIFAGVMVLLAMALRASAGQVRQRFWILGAGVLFPTAVLASLYVWTLPRMPVWKPVPPPGAVVVSVTGHMWWWEVRYRNSAGDEVATANEIRIPTGRPVYLALGSRDVIHSFWVPQLAGKMDMVPGRQQHLVLSADRPGTYRGQCAEFCGEQHALMALHVVAMEPGAFDAWLAGQARPQAASPSPMLSSPQAQAQLAQAPATARQVAGREAFLAQRCDACHTVRGVANASVPGPDLTHIGSRSHIAAGTLANTQAARERWIAHAQAVKPGARMPSYDRLDAETLAAIADWLGTLK